MSSLKRNPEISVDDLSSEFDPEDRTEILKKKMRNEVDTRLPGEEQREGRERAKHWFQEEHGRMFRQMSRLSQLDAYQRHKEIINQYYLYAQGANRHILERDTSSDRTDYDVLKDNHKFLWDDKATAETASNWEARLAKKYYDKLFKEYCIVDLAHYRSNKIAMRWRVEKEVKSGKGQFVCGNKKCTRAELLTSWEVNFSYVEGGERKNALVKVRLCPECSDNLNYGSKKTKVEKKKSSKKWKKRGDMSSEVKSEKRTSDEDNAEERKTDEKKETPQASSSEVWSAPAPIEIERTIDQDIDSFLDDLFD